MYIYQTEPNDNQKLKKKPFFNFEGHEKAETYLDALASEVMTQNFADNRFYEAESDCIDDLRTFAEWLGFDDLSDEYDALLSLIYEWQKISFKAGFQTARELLK